MSRTPCPLCGGTEARVRFRRPEIRVLVCPCGMGFAAADTRPEPYAAEYFERWVRGSGAGLARMKQATYRSVLARAVPPGARRLLDIGCALGWSLDAAREEGLEVVGVEPSEHAAAETGRRHPVKRSSTEIPDASVDVVTIIDVIEHVNDPVGMLREAARVLRPGGRVGLTTPDLTSPMARIMRSAWPMIIPEHVVYFDRATIRAALRRAGFVVLEVGPAVKTLRADYVAATLASRGDSLGRWGGRFWKLLGGLQLPLQTGDLLAVGMKPRGTGGGQSRTAAQNSRG